MASLLFAKFRSLLRPPTIAVMVACLIEKFQSLQKPPTGSSEDVPLEVKAVPGLMTLLDLALYRSVEGQLTATVCSAHNLLAAWLDLKRQAVRVLRCYCAAADPPTDSPSLSSRMAALESFCRVCCEAASDAVERLTTDRLAHTANLTDPFATQSSTSSSSYHSSDMAQQIQESADQTGRRCAPLLQRGKDCWETARLICPGELTFGQRRIA
jgi:hypothetical protein